MQPLQNADNQKEGMGKGERNQSMPSSVQELRERPKKKTVQDYFVSLFQNALSTLINK